MLLCRSVLPEHIGPCLTALPGRGASRRKRVSKGSVWREARPAIYLAVITNKNVRFIIPDATCVEPPAAQGACTLICRGDCNLMIDVNGPGLTSMLDLNTA